MKINGIQFGFSVLALAAACGNDTGTGAGAPSGGSGGAGGDPTSAGAGGTGGEPSGGSGGLGGVGGAGASGGGATTCLEPADAPFTLATDALCIVDVFDAPNLALAPYGTAPTWGRHGGPLTVAANGEELTLSRWSVTANTLSATSTSAQLAGLPDPTYWSAQINDFLSLNGDFSVTAWTGANFDTQGALVALEGNASSQSIATGVFGVATVASRVIYTGLSAANAPTNNVPGLYAADFESIANGFDASFLVDGFGLGSGPVAMDTDGRAFALMVDYIAGTQEARSYPATIATSTTPTVGTTLFELPGFGDALAAVAPADAEPGLLVYQPNGADGSIAETIAQPYDASGAAVGTPAVFLTLDEPETNLTLMTDGDGRLWIGVDGGASSTFYVLARPAG